MTYAESCLLYVKIGAGVQMTPNAIRLWYSWGLGPDLLKKAALPTGLNVRRWRDGEMLSYTRLTPDFEQKFGAPYFVIGLICTVFCMSMLSKPGFEYGSDVESSTTITMRRL